jgi:hypothetical protein
MERNGNLKFLHSFMMDGNAAFGLLIFNLIDVIFANVKKLQRAATGLGIQIRRVQ